ncbi:MAG: hypothetical protein U0414_16450 [Polyangiaceae bacterium]
MIPFAIATASLFLLTGCPGSLDHPEDFAGVPADILGPSCAKAQCHDSTTKAGKLDLSPDEGLRARLLDVTGSSGCGGKLVDTASPEKSLLLTKCMPNPACGTQMPQTGSLSENDIADLLDWIKTLKEP